ncbi:MAG: sulfurtransferase complex subunit TusB [Rhodospirillales bacterium]|nr:sulfurtransferase complex subunit TusB [Alphaproteobacteria bacterium]MBL6948226.1 sulfurtransferase complex subunit TusB [Rhodospirillales bacterium]
MLHTVNKSPFEKSSVTSCLRLAKNGSGILFLEDAVFAALQGTSVSDVVAGRAKDFQFYVLGPDLAARGLSEKPVIDGVEVIDYEGFVDLVEEHDAVHSWL